MPPVSFKQIGLGFDMFGCPNRCRHCYLGELPNGHISEDEVRWVAGLFRSFMRQGEDKPVFEKLWVSSCIREPDYCDDYRRLYDLEVELSDGKPWRKHTVRISCHNPEPIRERRYARPGDDLQRPGPGDGPQVWPA